MKYFHNLGLQYLDFRLHSKTLPKEYLHFRMLKYIEIYVPYVTTRAQAIKTAILRALFILINIIMNDSR